jgi:hypothetical protein
MEILIGLALLLVLKVAKITPFARSFEETSLISLKKAGLR